MDLRLGLDSYDDVNSWHWSFQDECPSYARWDKNQPDNYGGDQDCVMLHSNGYWHDEDCDLKCVTICQNGKTHILLHIHAFINSYG